MKGWDINVKEAHYTMPLNEDVERTTTDNRKTLAMNQFIYSKAGVIRLIGVVHKDIKNKRVPTC